MNDFLDSDFPEQPVPYEPQQPVQQPTQPPTQPAAQYGRNIPSSVSVSQPQPLPGQHPVVVPSSLPQPSMADPSQTQQFYPPYQDVNSCADMAYRQGETMPPTAPFPSGQFAQTYPQNSQPNPKKNGLLIALIVLVSVLSLILIGLSVAYFLEASRTPAPIDSPEKAAVELTPEQKAARLYAKVLDKIDTYEFLPNSDPDAAFTGYQYALADMTGDDIPELIVQTDGMVQWVRVFSADVQTNSVIAPINSLMKGARSAGGFRGSLSGSRNGEYLFYTVLESGTGLAGTQKVTIDGSALKYENFAEYTIGETSPISEQEVILDFISTTDLSLLEQLAGGKLPDIDEADSDNVHGAADKEADEQQDTRLSEEERKQQAIEQARTAGKNVYTGTLRVMTYDEVLQWDEKPDPNPGYHGNTQYVILLLDEPQEISARSSGDGKIKTKTEDAISLLEYFESEYGSDDADRRAELEAWRPYDGKPVVVEISEDIWWPSDASLPLGKPRAYPTYTSHVVWTGK